MRDYVRMIAPDGIRRVDVALTHIKDNEERGFTVDPNQDDRPERHGSTPNRHAGRVGIVVATGPSSGTADFAKFAELRALTGAVVWAVNDAWRTFNEQGVPGGPDYYMVLDEPYWLSYRVRIAAYLQAYPKCVPVLCFDPWENLPFQKIAIDVDPGDDYRPNAYFHSDSSGNCACQMALHTGVSTLYLIGHDLRTVHGHTHCFGTRRPEEVTNDYPQGKGMVKGYELLSKHAAQLKVRAVNLSAVSALTCFERSDIDTEIRLWKTKSGK